MTFCHFTANGGELLWKTRDCDTIYMNLCKGKLQVQGRAGTKREIQRQELQGYRIGTWKGNWLMGDVQEKLKSNIELKLKSDYK